MMTKPPGFASSSTLPMDEEDEESIDESLDEILLEANERPVESPVKSLDPTPEPSRLASLLAMGDDSPEPVPLPGLSRTASAPQNEITVIAPRPIFPDELADGAREEETKVESYETAVRATATRDDTFTGLSSQASEQRDRALRKTSTTAARGFPRRLTDEAEFEEPDTAGALLGGGPSARAATARDDLDAARTPADMPLSDDDDAESEPSPPGGYLASTGAGGFPSRLPPPIRTSPPPGRPDIYPGRRIPTPSSDYLSSPTGGYGSGSHYPSIAIPAPSSATETSVRTTTSVTDGRVRLPIGGLAGFLVTAFGGGLLVGALLWRGHAPPAPVETAVISHPVPRAPAEAMQGIVVKPVPPPVAAAPAPAPASAAAPPAAAALTPVAAATKPAPASSAGATPGPTMPTLAAETPPAVDPAAEAAAAKAAARRAAARPKKTTSLDDDVAAAEAAAAPPPAPKPARSKKKAVVWQDPFAQ